MAKKRRNKPKPSGDRNNLRAIRRAGGTWQYPWAAIKAAYFSGVQPTELAQRIIDSTPDYDKPLARLRAYLRKKFWEGDWARERVVNREQVKQDQLEAIRQAQLDEVVSVARKAIEILLVAIRREMRYIVAVTRQYPGLVNGDPAEMPCALDRIRYLQAEERMLDLLERIERRMGLGIDSRATQPQQSGDIQIDLPDDLPADDELAAARNETNKRLDEYPARGSDAEA
ncbi:hypothetical protein J7K50_02165 [bacterium]|nr:hypothetical protein [bacterium]